jgi:predicted XRE-type DNA-binding protein
VSALAQPEMTPQDAAAELIDAYAGDPTWLDAFAEAFERQRGGHQLARILRVWGLSQSEAGRLFGVTRQAVAKWLDGGIPTERTDRVADVAAATDLLTHYLKRDRIPAVVRRPAPALGGRSLLDLVAEDEPRHLLDACREMFAFGDAHT